MLKKPAYRWELLGHEFYVFLNSDTNEVNVVYKRRDGAYGLIEPELDPYHRVRIFLFSIPHAKIQINPCLCKFHFYLSQLSLGSGV